MRQKSPDVEVKVKDERVVQAGAATRSWLGFLTASHPGEFVVQHDGGSARIRRTDDGTATIVGPLDR